MHTDEFSVYVVEDKFDNRCLTDKFHYLKKKLLRLLIDVNFG